MGFWGPQAGQHPLACLGLPNSTVATASCVVLATEHCQHPLLTLVRSTATPKPRKAGLCFQGSTPFSSSRPSFGSLLSHMKPTFSRSFLSPRRSSYSC